VVEAGGVAALSLVFQRIVYLIRRKERWLLVAEGAAGKEQPLVFHCGGQHGFLGYGGAHCHPLYGGAALEQGEGRWLLISSAGATDFQAPAGARVAGVTSMRGISSVALLTIGPDPRQVTVVGPGGLHPLPRASAEVAHATANPIAAQLAYVTLRGEVVVYSLAHQAVIYRVGPEGKP
jgi:hypothetical protein